MFGIERNEPCWCGSGKKYKACHMRGDENILSPLEREGYIIPERHLILTPSQIEGMQKSANLTKSILDKLEQNIKKGMSTLEIDAVLHNLTIEANAIPAPLNYNGFPKSCCTSLNDVICHGIPSEKEILKNGDILNIDLTTILNGYFSDMSRMYKIGDVSEKADKLVDIAKKCLVAGIEAVKPYEPISKIGDAINGIADEYGYSVVRSFCGHGIGLKFHEEPNVNHYRTTSKAMIMVPNMVFTIEPMINEGTYECSIDEKDGWTARTKDGKLSAQWEHTILVTEDGYRILTD